jgi:hypothetical protein
MLRMMGRAYRSSAGRTGPCSRVFSVGFVKNTFFRKTIMHTVYVVSQKKSRKVKETKTGFI